jgi:hypothetical protein
LSFAEGLKLARMTDIFTSKNFKLLGLSILFLVVGYILLGQGPVENPLSWTVAPIILVCVYCIFIPWAILAKENKTEETQK